MLQVLALDPEALLYHAEVIWRDGVRVGDIRAASYGHTLGKDFQYLFCVAVVTTIKSDGLHML